MLRSLTHNCFHDRWYLVINLSSWSFITSNIWYLSYARATSGSSGQAAEGDEYISQG